MSGMKKMIASNRLTANIIGVALGIIIGLHAANIAVSCCKSCGCADELKKCCKKAFKVVEEKIKG